MRSQTHNGVLEVVAAINIEAGTEQTDSFVDLVSTTDTRRQNLITKDSSDQVRFISIAYRYFVHRWNQSLRSLHKSRTCNKGALAMANDDIEADLSLLSEAIELLLTTTHETFSLDMYQVRCQRLSSWIVAQQLDEALRDCRHVVAVLGLALSHISSHPLLGLQLFTLGDLYEACGLLEQTRPKKGF